MCKPVVLVESMIDTSRFLTSGCRPTPYRPDLGRQQSVGAGMYWERGEVCGWCMGREGAGGISVI